MPEVDYSKFVYKRNGDEKPLSETNITENGAAAGRKEPTEEYIKERRYPERKKKTGCLFVIFVLILCFGLIFLITDIVSDGKIVAAIGGVINKNSYEYYLVVSENVDKGAAYEKSLTVKQGGGAGYIYISEGKNYVVYSAYPDMNSAEKVAAKNEEVSVLTIGKKTRDGFYGKMNGFFGDFCEAVSEYEQGKIADSNFLGKIEKIKTSTESLLEEKLSADKSELCHFVVSGISSLNVSDGVKSEFLSKVRYFMTGWAVSICGNG